MSLAGSKLGQADQLCQFRNRRLHIVLGLDHRSAGKVKNVHSSLTSNSRSNCKRVISHAISFGTIVLDVPENRVVLTTHQEWTSPFMWNTL